MMPDIEEIVIRELNGLCASCIHHDGCIYRKRSDKVVIQCEVFESLGGTTAKVVGSGQAKGLCVNCIKNPYCHLSREASGVWHCEEYE